MVNTNYKPPTAEQGSTITFEEGTALSPILNRKDYKYVRRVPTLACNSVSGLSEIARWVLDMNQILHLQKNHAPFISIKKLNKLTGNDGVGDNPVLIHTDSLIYKPVSIIQYYDRQNPKAKHLFPDDEQQRQKVVDLYNWFVKDLNNNIWGYLYSEFFTSKKKSKSLLKRGVPFGERLRISFFFKGIKKGLTKEWNMEGKDSILFLVEIQKIFAAVSKMRAASTTKYLCGDNISAADIAFAAIAAPIILPQEFGGTLTKFNELTEEIRQESIRLRSTAAGQYVLRMYQEDRPINLDLGKIPKKPGPLGRFMNRIKVGLSNGQSGAFYFLQKNIPVLKIGLAKAAIVSRHDLVVDVLKRDRDFTVKEINAKKMSDQKGAFFLGMDKPDPQHERELNFTRAASKRGDVQRIRKFIREKADAITAELQTQGKLDVVQSLTYPVLDAFLDDYFGVPAPVNAQFNRWQRTMFFDLFLNFTNNKKKHALAVQSGKERIAWVRGLISKRRKQYLAGETLGDSLLNRMIILQQEEQYASWVDDDVIRRNIGGLLTGISEGTNKAVIHVLQELFKRPDILKGAIDAAQNYDADRLTGYIQEGLRFNPVQPGVLRFSESKQYIKGSSKKQYTIKGNWKLLALTSGAMFDPTVFPEPKTFNPSRDARYMNWGFGLHECFGKYINPISITEIVGAVLRLKNVRLAKGALGRGSGLMDGPFPNNYLVTFDLDFGQKM